MTKVIYNIFMQENSDLVRLTVKSVRIRSYSGPYFPAFGLNMGRYRVSLRIQYKWGKMRTRKTPNTDTSRAVSHIRFVL